MGSALAPGTALEVRAIAVGVTPTHSAPLRLFPPHYLSPPIGFFLLNSSERLSVQVCAMQKRRLYGSTRQGLLLLPVLPVS